MLQARLALQGSILSSFFLRERLLQNGFETSQAFHSSLMVFCLNNLQRS